jgi:hypothetical protein
MSEESKFESETEIAANGALAIPDRKPLAVVPAEQAAVIALSGQNDRPHKMWCSIRKDDVAMRAVILKASQAADEHAADLGKDAWPTAHILAHEVDCLDDATGELRTLTRLVLIRPDGKTCDMVSEGARKSMQLIIGLYGPPPWSPALMITVERKKTRRGFTTFLLSVQEPAPANVRQPGKRGA